MKLINNYISEKLIINKNTDCGHHLINNINQSLLEYYSKDDIKEIIEWTNNLPSEIRPLLITNILDMKNYEAEDDPKYAIYLFYTENYKKYNIDDIPYIRFWNDLDGLSVDIYDDFNKRWMRSAIQESTPDNIKKCFKFVESRSDELKIIVNYWNEKHK